MTYHLVYCPACGHCQPRDEEATTLPCGHSPAPSVKMRREVIMPYEIVIVKVRNSSQAKAMIMPDGNGGRFVEYKKKGHKIPSLASVPDYLANLEKRAPVLAEAFRARGDVRRM